jgi:hypothetical protein
LTERPGVAAFDNDLAEEKIAHRAVQILDERRLAAQENQFWNIGANVSGSGVDVVIGVPGDATADLADRRQLIDTVRKRDLNLKPVDFITVVANRKTAGKKSTARF